MDNTNTTPMGTPWASTWDKSWAASVAAKETELDRRVCGARTLSGEPCTLTSDHHTGRCRYHGGTEAIGAPLGNQNARVHGLYARRLQRCGTHCPMWDHCPFAGDDVLALEPKDRPICAYEAAEYESLLEEFSEGDDAHPSFPRSTVGMHTGDDSDGLPPEGIFQHATRRPPKSPSQLRLEHNLALMHVMLSRAAAALSITPLTDTVESTSERYQLHTTKVHPALQAFLRIGRECRALQAQYDKEMTRATEEATDRPPSLADLATPILERADGVLEEAIAAENERRERMKQLERFAQTTLGDDWERKAFLSGGDSDGGRAPPE